MGRKMSCSSNLISELESCSKTLVSSTNNLRWVGARRVRLLAAPATGLGAWAGLSAALLLGAALATLAGAGAAAGAAGAVLTGAGFLERGVAAALLGAAWGLAGGVSGSSSGTGGSARMTLSSFSLSRVPSLVGNVGSGI